MPKTLSVGALLAALAAVSGITAAVLIMTIGRSLMVSLVSAKTGVDLTESGLETSGAVGGAYQILWNRSIFWLIFAVIYLALVASLRVGQTWARIVFTLFAPLASALLVYDISDEGVPSLLKVFDGLNVGFAIAAIVLVWLGPSNAYVRARKAFRRGRALSS